MSGSRQAQRLAGVAMVVFGMCLLCHHPPALGTQTITASVARDGQQFDIEFNVSVAAPADDVFELLTQYENLVSLSPSTTKSEWVTIAGRRVLRVGIDACVLIFCKHMIKNSLVQPLAERKVRYRGVADGASFYVADETLSVASQVDGALSVVRYSARLQPKFHVPMVVRGWMIRLVLERDLHATLQNVERILNGAKGQAAAVSANPSLDLR